MRTAGFRETEIRLDGFYPRCIPGDPLPISEQLQRGLAFYHRDGRVSTMASKPTTRKQPPIRPGLLQGTLDMLILRTLLLGPAHGHRIAKHIQRTTEDVLQVEHGSLYPALHRMERKGWIISKW